MAAVKRGRGQAGFTLLEMVVALALVTVAVFLAAGLLREFHEVSRRTAREALNPLEGIAVRMLRNDVHGSRGILSPPPFPGFWSSRPLDLDGHPPGPLRYQVEGGELLRLVLDEHGKVSSRRTVLHGAVALRWRPLGPGLLQLELSYRRTRLGASWRLGDGNRREAPDESLETEGLVLALREAPRGAGW